MAELKKCPFCGSKARIVENHDWGTVHIRCDDEFGTCSVLPCTEDLYHPHEAEKEWTTRAGTTEAEIRNKAIDEFVRAIEKNQTIQDSYLSPPYFEMSVDMTDILKIAEQLKGEQ